MKNVNKILNLLSAFMAVIGICAATLVCFIVIYSQINGGFSPKAHNSSTQTNNTAQTNSPINISTNETATSLETDSIEDNLTNNLNDNNYASTVADSPGPESLEPDFDLSFADNEIYTSTGMQGSEITETITQTAGIQSANENSFDIYNNPDQQQTTFNYVLNTNPDRMKIHYPSCNDVSKIAPENYSTSNLSIDELKSQGYTTCGHCFR